MNRREAKRLVCGRLGNDAIAMIPELRTIYPDQADRFEEAALELAEELYRRGGREAAAREIDERQLSIYDALDELTDMPAREHDDPLEPAGFSRQPFWGDER